MSDETQNTDETSEAPVDELAMLKKRADSANLKYHPNIGVDGLRKKLEEHLDESSPKKADDKKDDNTDAGKDDTDEDETADEAPAENKAQRRNRLRREATRLVRVRITNLNGSKKDLGGEIFTVANGFIGTIKRFVPYGELTEEGTHIEHAIFKQLKSRKFLQVRTRKDPRRPGHLIVDQKWVPEFALEVLEPLTKDELKELARTQAASGNLND